MIGTGTLIGGSATLVTSSLVVGSHSITAVYGGTTNFLESGSSIVSEIVKTDATTTTVTSSANPAMFGQSVTLTATVTPAAPGAGTPTGTVVFTDGSNVLGQGTLNDGEAILNTSGLVITKNVITLIYGGDHNFVGSESKPFTQTVSKDSTFATLSSSANPSNFGEPVTFSATVTPADAVGERADRRCHLQGRNEDARNGGVAGGTASLTTASLAIAVHSITASYGGDPDFLASTSSSIARV